MQCRAGKLRQIRKEATASGSTCAVGCLATFFARNHKFAGFLFGKACLPRGFLIRLIFSMSTGYQVIARRWRPKQFDELVGQEHIVRTLKNAIGQNRLAHAYLFVGPRGTGKTTTARIFAKALNCENGPSATPDDNSPLCKAIMEGSCMDVVEIDGASNNSVDNIRDLREDSQYTPAQGRFKIYIIDEVHMLSAGAFNALLKILEEPPAHVKFILATTEINKVPATIHSRCQRFEFRPISDEKIAEKLGQIAQAEKISIDADALASVARLAAGGMRDAQSILDQLISFCGEKITEKDVTEVYGLASRQQVDDLAKALAAADYAGLVALCDTLAEEGKDLFRVLVDLQARVRDALLKAVRTQNKTDALGAPMRTEQLLRALDVLHKGEAALRTGLNEKVNFEVTLLKAVEEARTKPIDSVLKDLSDIAASLPTEAGQKKIEVFEQPPAQASEPMDEPPPFEDTEIEEPPQESFEDAVAFKKPDAAPVEPPVETPIDPASVSWDNVPEQLRAILKDRLHASLGNPRAFKPEDLH